MYALQIQTACQGEGTTESNEVTVPCPEPGQPPAQDYSMLNITNAVQVNFPI